MDKKMIKVYVYTRVSTEMQIDGYSLAAQEEMLNAYADMHKFTIVGRYSDEGKSGKSIQGRPEFRRMLNDIKTRKDDVRYVMVFKLSRFGRNSADVINSLEFIRKYGVDLICVKDGIRSEEGAGKLMINILAAVAEIERENIHEQTMAGRKQKAREGKWNGGFAPYGYKLLEGKLEIEEDEADVVRKIFDLFVHTELGYTGVARYLEMHGIKKKQRQNGKLQIFTKEMVKNILDNPVYAGKIAYGRTKQIPKKDNPEILYRVEVKDYDVYDGIHQPIVDEEIFRHAKIKRQETTRKLVKKHDVDHEHLLSGILKCPECGAGMYGNISRNKKKDGTYYRTYYQYGCKHRNGIEGHKCEYRKTLNEGKIDAAVAELIKDMVKKPQFANVLKKKINDSVDVNALIEEKNAVEKQIRNQENTQKRLMDQQDDLDIDLLDYERRYEDLSARIDKAYDKINELESQVAVLNTRIENSQKDKISSQNIHYYLQAFGQLYDQMTDTEKKTMYNSLVKEIHVYKEPLANGQIIKSIEFSFPIDEAGTTVLCVDEKTTVETVCLFSKKCPV